jgi:hypothetical protein
LLGVPSRHGWVVKDLAGLAPGRPRGRPFGAFTGSCVGGMPIDFVGWVECASVFPRTLMSAARNPSGGRKPDGLRAAIGPGLMTTLPRCTHPTTRQNAYADDGRRSGLFGAFTASCVGRMPIDFVGWVKCAPVFPRTLMSAARNPSGGRKPDGLRAAVGPGLMTTLPRCTHPTTRQNAYVDDGRPPWVGGERSCGPRPRPAARAAFWGFHGVLRWEDAD